MALRLALAVLGLAALLAMLYWLAGERETGLARTSAAKDGRSEAPARLAPEPIAPAGVSGRSEEPVQRVVPPRDESSPGPEASAAAAGAGHRLSGVVLHAADRRPAAGAALVFWHGEEYEEVATDEAGHFETIVPSGAVRVWHRGDLPDPTLAEHREIRPDALLLAEPAPGGDFEPVELLLVDPAAWVEVEVVDDRALPATAELRWLFRPPRGGGTSMRSPTDASGRARVAFPSVDPGAYLLLVARTEEQVSEIARVEAPPGGERVRLVLDAGGRIRVQAREADGSPRANQVIQAEDPEAQHRLLDLGSRTDAEGLALFQGVPPGRRRVQFYSEELAEWVRASVEVERALTTEVELRVPALPIAAAGRVVDADDRPVGNVTVVARIGGRSNSTDTDAQGTFSFGASRGGSVLLSTESGIQQDRYAPRALEVPFGTRDVVFRGVEARPTQTLALEVLELGANRRIPDAMVLGFVEPERSSWSFHRAKEGLVTFELKLYDDVGFSVEAVGYRRRIVRAAELARDVPAGVPCRVVLAPGLERWLQVLDADDEPLIDARILDGERQVAITDGDGRALIELAHWPAELRVRAAGHAEGLWNCRDWISELGDGVIWLPRVPADSGPR